MTELIHLKRCNSETVSILHFEWIKLTNIFPVVKFIHVILLMCFSKKHMKLFIK